MITARELLHSIDRLAYPERIRVLAAHARRQRGSAELGALLRELSDGDPFTRDVAVFLATVARDTVSLSGFLRDADPAVQHRAIKAWLHSGEATPANVARLLDDAPYATRRIVYAYLRRNRRRAGVRGIADEIVDGVRARFGAVEAGRVLPACTAPVVERLLPGLGAVGGTWRATAAAHPDAALAEARTALDELPVAQRDTWWASFGGGVFAVARTRPVEVLDLLTDHAPVTRLPGPLPAYGLLAKAYPERVLDLMLAPQRAAWVRTTVLPRSLLTRLVALPDGRLAELAVRLREGGRLPDLLARLAPSRRDAVFDAAYAEVDLARLVLADSLLAVLPWRRRATEARRILGLERTQAAGTAAERVRLTAFLPWADARQPLLDAARSPVADERAHAYEQLVCCAGRSDDPAVVTELAGLLTKLRNEQDPVRSRALAALGGVPARLVEPAAIDALTTIFGDALAARDASMPTRSAVQRVALGVLVQHATEPLLAQAALLWLEAVVGDDRVPYLGRLRLRRGQEHAAYAAVREWIDNGVRRNKYSLLFGFTAALGRRAYGLVELQEQLHRALRTGRPSSVVRRAVELWLDDPRHRDTRVDAVLRADPSAIALPAVWAIVQARRTDLLDQALTGKPPAGAFLAEGPRWVPGYAPQAARWLPRHRARYVELLGALAADAGATVSARIGAIAAAAYVPGAGWDLIRRWHDSPNVALAEASLAALARTDRAAEALPLLLAHTGDDRARVAVYALRRAARFVAPAELGEVLTAALAGPLKVTSRKEIVRLAADFSVPTATTLVYAEWRRPDAHRDVRAALVGVARTRLEQAYAWPILAEAAESGEYASTVALAAVHPLGLAAGDRPRYAELLLTASRSADPKAALYAWNCVPGWAAWAAGVDDGIAAALTDLSPDGHWRNALAALLPRLRAGSGYTTVDGVLRRLVELDRADSGGDPERDRLALRRAFGLLSSLAGAVRADPTGLDLDALAATARAAADHDPLLVTAVTLLVETTGETGPAEACDRLSGRPVAAAEVADLIRAAGVRREWTREVAPRLAADLRDRGDHAGGLTAVALTRLGATLGFAEPYRGLVLSLRSHPVADVRDAAYAVRLSDRG